MSDIGERFAYLIDLLRDMHLPDEESFCREDGFTWPCSTIQALNEAMGMVQDRRGAPA